MNTQKNICLMILVISGLLSCKKDEVGKTADNIASLPVTVQNAMAYRPDPTVSTSKSAGGTIQVVLAIPAGTGRTIKEITKVAANTSYTQIQSSGTSGFYTSAPIPGNGTTVTFNTTLSEYMVKFPGIVPPSNTELVRRFYFLLTLDNGSTIVTTPVRVLVLD